MIVKHTQTPSRKTKCVPCERTTAACTKHSANNRHHKEDCILLNARAPGWAPSTCKSAQANHSGHNRVAACSVTTRTPLQPSLWLKVGT